MRNALGCSLSKGEMDLGVWGKHRKSTREQESYPPWSNLLLPWCVTLPKGVGWAWRTKTQGPVDGKHLGLSGPHAVDGGGVWRKMKGLETGGGGNCQVGFCSCS